MRARGTQARSTRSQGTSRRYTTCCLPRNPKRGVAAVKRPRREKERSMRSHVAGSLALVMAIAFMPIQSAAQAQQPGAEGGDSVRLVLPLTGTASGKETFQ